MSRPTLSVVMIVKDEAGCLGRCLDAVRSIADEIVVGDTGSSDDTIAVAERFGAKVLEIPWHNDFAEARNRVLEAATGDWLLHLDADEVVDAANAERIRGVVDADGAAADAAPEYGGGADAIEVMLANYSNDARAWRWVPVEPGDPMAAGYAGYIAVPLLRLFRNGRGYEYREPVHESITESVIEAGGVIRREPILIHHYGYESEGKRDERKARLYLDIERKKVQQRPGDAKAWHDLAEQSLALGEVEEAEAAARKALSLEPAHLGAATTLANLLLNRGDLDEAREVLEAVHTADTPPHVATALGAIACTQGRLEEAMQTLDSVLERHPKTLMARLYLARALDRLGDSAGAAAQLEQALALAPSLQETQERVAAHRLRLDGERAYTEGKMQDTLAATVEAVKRDPEDPIAHNNLGVVLTALGERARAEEAFRRALHLAPDFEDAKENLAALSRA